MTLHSTSRHSAAPRARRGGLMIASAGSLLSISLLAAGFLVTRGGALSHRDPGAMLLEFLGLSVVIFGILFVAFMLIVRLPPGLSRRARG